MAGETGIIDYNGTQRPWDSVIEPVFGGPLKAGYRKRQWNHADGSLFRGYQHPDSALAGTCIAPSPARQVELDAINSTIAASKALDDEFMADLQTLAIAVRDNTATAAQQRRCIWKLFRALRGLLRD